MYAVAVVATQLAALILNMVHLVCGTEKAERGGTQMTEAEYSYLMTFYFAGNYCEAMSFNEYVLRYGRQLLEKADIGSDYYGRKKDVLKNNC
mgnify:CR=1 FL=1